eukprot:4704619-Lingulodinium_polyedra.AAC.1
MDLGAAWSGRVETSDASCQGHGRAYAFVDPPTVQRWARWCNFRGTYTSDLEDFELRPEEDSRCPLHVADFPLEQFFWHE